MGMGQGEGGGGKLTEMGLPYGYGNGLWVERSLYETWPGYFVVFLGKTRKSHSDPFCPGE